ncbi:protein-L-isoaspartate(D-aspartate) O-methyltransferase [Streptacidiphilus sp. MAP12-33]|uniref:methyltransferase, FxLD system n=1 Tax=Streptacidiphilus sp. MAP12-33 TaxID=3156266 RepID=UPI0035181AF0
MTNQTPAAADPTELRATMVRAMREQNSITTPAVEDAFTSVPRHLFAPGADLAVVYDLHRTVRVTADENGLELSVMSAAHLQGVMLEQLAVEPGMSVLEIGSGGVNAAYLQHLVGEQGQVTTVDIDPVVIAQARACLDEAGYTTVTTVVADAQTGLPDEGLYDRIIVTVEAWSIPEAWFDRLKPNGRIVVPLSMRGTTRSIAFDRDGQQLTSRSYALAVFVPMQGAGVAQVRKAMIRDGIAVQSDDPRVTLDPPALDKALDSPRTVLWSGAAYDLPDELDLYLSLNLPRVARLHADQSVIDAGVVEPSARLGVAALVSTDSIAYRTRRENPELGGFESGVVAHGPDADTLAEQYADALRTWADNHRQRGAAHFTYLPGAVPEPLPPHAVSRNDGAVIAHWH